MIQCRRKIRTTLLFTVTVLLLIGMQFQHRPVDELVISNLLPHSLEEERSTTVVNDVLFMVLTAERLLSTRAKAVWKTWAASLNGKIVFACNCPNVIKVKNLLATNSVVPKNLAAFREISSMLPILHVDIKESRKTMGRKVVAVLNASYDLYVNKVAFWYMVADDAYIYVDNLYKLTATVNTSEPNMYGFKFRHRPKPGGFIHAGPGILITNESMTRLVNKIKTDGCEKHIDPLGDVTIGGCAYPLGIKFFNASDQYGKPKFHYFDPFRHYYGPLHSFIYIQGTHNRKIGKECCSAQSIGFHHVNHSLMYAIHANKTLLKDLFS